MTVPSLSDIEHRLQAGDLDEWLRLWRVEQGASKPAALALMAGAIPADPAAPLRVLDLCAGPGDVGRTIHARFARAEVDAIDRDPLLISLCKLANARAGIAGRALHQDLADPEWRRRVDGGYDVAAIGYALHWFALDRARALLAEVLDALRPGGMLVFLEPVAAEPAFRASFDAWRATQAPEHSRQAWLDFWTRVNAFLGHEHMNVRGAPPAGRIGDSLTVAGWSALAREAGFADIDVLMRDADKLVLAAVRPG